MPETPFAEDELKESRQAALAAAQLARDPDAFREAFEAFRASDGDRFRAALERVSLVDRCRLICIFFCRKHCVGVCRRFCPGAPPDVTADEVREFALAYARLSDDQVKRLVEIISADDVQAWQEELTRLELTRFCHQVCYLLCAVRCRLHCFELCPPAPLITNVGSIPTPTQVGPQGFGNGPGVPPANVPPPNPPAGVGDHPFGGTPTVKGIFNMSTATQYKLEVADNPGGPYSEIAVSVDGRNYISTPPFVTGVVRNPSGPPDPGWYNVSEIADSDGGPNAIGEKRLLDWPTGMLADGIYFLRLRVRDGTSERVSSPQIVQTDNTAPPTPVITLELREPSGELKLLKCGQVKRGQGLIRVTVQAFDVNFSRLGVAAQGNSSLSVPVIGVPEGSPPGTPAGPLSKTYNGNIADQGYPTPTSFLWDPWADPRIVPCCYVVRIDINDRALSSNVWAGGHGNSGWEAVEIGF